MRFRLKKKMPDLNPKQPETLKLCVAEYMRANPTAEAKLYKHGKAGYGQAGNIAIGDLAEYVDNIEDMIRDRWGGGEYHIRFYDGSGKEIARYHENVIGPSKTKSEDNGDNTGSSSVYKDLAMKALEGSMNPTQNLKALAETMQMLQPQGNGNGESGIIRELLTTLVNNTFIEKETALDNTQKVLEIAKALQPTIPPEDPTVAIAQSVIPLITAMMASKGGNSNAIMQALQSNPQLAGQIQSALSGTTQPKPQQLPEPGQQPGEPPQPPAKQPQLAPQDKKPMPAEAVPSSDKSLIDDAVEKFRGHIREKVDADRLTQLFVSMVQLAQIWTPEHPLFKSLINEDNLDKLEHEFDRFCAAIPELVENEELKNQMKIRLAAMLMAVDMEQQDDIEEDENVSSEEDRQADIQQPERISDDENFPEPPGDLSGDAGGEVKSAVAGG